jgi:hypothetical protein
MRRSSFKGITCNLVFLCRQLPLSRITFFSFFLFFLLIIQRLGQPYSSSFTFYSTRPPSPLFLNLLSMLFLPATASASHTSSTPSLFLPAYMSPSRFMFFELFFHSYFTYVLACLFPSPFSTGVLKPTSRENSCIFHPSSLSTTSRIISSYSSVPSTVPFFSLPFTFENFYLPPFFPIPRLVPFLLFLRREASKQ